MTLGNPPTPQEERQPPNPPNGGARNYYELPKPPIWGVGGLKLEWEQLPNGVETYSA